MAMGARESLLNNNISAADSRQPLLPHHDSDDYGSPNSKHDRSKVRKYVLQGGILLTIAVAVLLWNTLGVFGPYDYDHHTSSPDVLTERSALIERAAPSTLLEDFQVYPPVLTVNPQGKLEITDGSSNASVQLVPNSNPTCQQTLAVHSFANSYGAPFVGQYSPPSCSFNRVSWNLTVQVAGVQYDRLGSVWLGDIEVFRLSTAEPTETGIYWTYIKDMTSFLPLFKKQQTLIFDLGNVFNVNYTGIYNATLTASYFTAGDSIEPADVILPLSTRQSSQGQASLFSVPPDTASNALTFPQNAKKAIFTVAATGQIDEEFWWSNVPQSRVDTFPNLLGYSPFREVQLYIDGMLAGVAWPYPIIFTGGVVPGLWRPIVGIDAFDLKEDEIDITPFLPLLCDGKSHNFTVRVSGLNDNGNGAATLSETTGGYWLVSGKAFIWLDADGHVTTGSTPTRNFPAPDFQVTSSVSQNKKGANNTLIYNVKAQRSLSVSSTLKLSTGSQQVYWKQNLNYTNFGNYSQQGALETNIQNTNSYAESSDGYRRSSSYPLNAFVRETFKDNILTLTARLSRTKDVATIGQPVFPTGLESFAATENFHSKYPNFEGALLSTTQTGHANYIANETSGHATSTGTTAQNMTFAGIQVSSGNGNSGYFPDITGNDELFSRQAKAVRSEVVYDKETLVDQPIGHSHSSGAPSVHDFVLKRLPGRKNIIPQ